MNDQGISSVSTSNSSISSISILSNFLENSFAPTYSYIQVVFFIVIICSLIVNLICYLSCGLAWENSTDADNPITDTIKAQTLELLTINSLLNTGDMLTYNVNNSTLNLTRLVLYTITLNYTADFITIQNDNFRKFKDNLYTCLTNYSSLLEEPFNSLWSTPINVSDPSITLDSIQTSVQTVTYLELMMNYAVDMNRFSYLNLEKGTMMYLTYSSSVASIQNVTNFSTYINNSIATSK